MLRRAKAPKMLCLQVADDDPPDDRIDRTRIGPLEVRTTLIETRLGSVYKTETIVASRLKADRASALRAYGIAIFKPLQSKARWGARQDHAQLARSISQHCGQAIRPLLRDGVEVEAVKTPMRVARDPGLRALRGK